jgi:hypothetical protein
MRPNPLIASLIAMKGSGFCGVCVDFRWMHPCGRGRGGNETVRGRKIKGFGCAWTDKSVAPLAQIPDKNSGQGSSKNSGTQASARHLGKKGHRTGVSNNPGYNGKMKTGKWKPCP